MPFQNLSDNLLHEKELICDHCNEQRAMASAYPPVSFLPTCYGTTGCVLPRIPHHSPASSCLFLQECREKLTFCKMLEVSKDAFQTPLLKLTYTDSGCHHQCCGVSGFVVCFGIFVCLFVPLLQTMAALQAFYCLEFLFHINITVMM